MKTEAERIEEIEIELALIKDRLLPNREPPSHSEILGLVEDELTKVLDMDLFTADALMVRRHVLTALSIITGESYESLQDLQKRGSIDAATK